MRSRLNEERQFAGSASRDIVCIHFPPKPIPFLASLLVAAAHEFPLEVRFSVDLFVGIITGMASPALRQTSGRAVPSWRAGL